MIRMERRLASSWNSSGDQAALVESQGEAVRIPNRAPSMIIVEVHEDVVVRAPHVCQPASPPAQCCPAITGMGARSALMEPEIAPVGSALQG